MKPGLFRLIKKKIRGSTPSRIPFEGTVGYVARAPCHCTSPNQVRLPSKIQLALVTVSAHDMTLQTVLNKLTEAWLIVSKMPEVASIVLSVSREL